jgi:hypothetical protein
MTGRRSQRRMKKLSQRRNVVQGGNRNEVAVFHGVSNPQRSLTRKPGGTTNCRRHHHDGEHAKEILFH